MSRDYFDRYQFFIDDGTFRIVPGIEIPIKGTDKYILFKKGKDLDIILKWLMIFIIGLPLIFWGISRIVGI